MCVLRALMLTCLVGLRARSVDRESKQESSAKLTNQRVSYAFTSSPFSFHACHILPASKFQLFLYFTYFLQASVNSMYENSECVNTVHWFEASSSGNPNE